MTIPTIFTCPNPYWDEKGYQAAITQLQQDTLWSYDQAWLGPQQWVEDPRQVLHRWAIQNKGVQGDEACLVMSFKGHLFSEVELMFPAGPDFLVWEENVYRPAAAHIYNRVNNWGAWGLLGCVLSDTILGNDLKPHEYRFYQFISRATDSNGVLIEEVARPNWYWYCYFALAPLLRVAQLLPGVNKYMLLPSLNWYWQECQNPKKRLYKPGLFGWRNLFISQLELPSKTDNWPVNLWWVAGKEFDKPEWQAYGNPPPYRDVIFRHG